MTRLPYAFEANFHDPNVPSSHPSDALTLSAGCLSPLLIDPFPDFDVIKEWILEPELSGMPAGGNPSESFENQSSGNSISSSGVNCTRAGQSPRGVVGNSFCENEIASFVGQRPSAEKQVSDSGVGEGGGAAVLKAEVVDGFLRKMKIEDDREIGRLGEIAVHVKEEVVEEDGGGVAFASVGGDWEKGGASGGSASAGGSEEKDATVSEDGSSSSSSSSDTSSSREEEEEEDDDDSDNDDDDVEEEEAGPASSSASSSSSSLEDADSDDAEVEEGEIRDLKSRKSGEMSVDSDIDEEEEMMKGPIKSMNELDPENLPPVPSFDVTLEPQHSTLPVGVVLSIMDNKVVVEGSEKHNALTEGSILWITEKRLPLGLVDELFGPVKNPYYVVRYNSDKEVPPGVREGTAVSFVPEFADYVLNNKDIYKKGYDASGENDEEIPDEVEFSDDEKEAEYRKSQQRTAKRPTIDKKVKQLESMDRKKVQNRGGFFNRNRSSDSAGIKSLPPLSSSAVMPLIPGHDQMGPSSGQFVNGISFHSASQPPFPSMAPPVCPPQIVNIQQMPSLSMPAVCSPHIPNGQQVPNLPSNNFGLVGCSFTPVPGPLGTCGTMANTFNAHGLPVLSTQGVQQPSYPVSSLQNIRQQPPSAWTMMPLCQQQQQQQPVFSGVQNSPWRCEPAGQQLSGLLENRLQGVQNFASPSAFPQQSVPQAPGCMNWQGFMNQPNLNGVAFPGGNMHGNPAANAIPQWNPMGGFNAEQTGHFNPNQCLGQFVPRAANNFSSPKQCSQMNAPDNRRRQSTKGGNFHKRRGHWQRPRQ